MRMTIDWMHFTPWASLAGGVLLGLSAALFILLRGRILGISGIVGGLMGRRPDDVGWGLAGLCPGPALVSLGAGQAEAAVFVRAILAGMMAFQWTTRRMPQWQADGAR